MTIDNPYIRKIQQLLAIRPREEAIQRMFSMRAGMILGRHFNESMTDYLDRKPYMKEFFEWSEQFTNEAIDHDLIVTEKR